MSVKIKICCIASIEEAKMAISYGADALGLVGAMPSGPGAIDDIAIREIVHQLPDEIDTFLLTSEVTPEGIVAHHWRAPTTTLQLVDAPVEDAYKKIRELLPAVTLVQVIHVLDELSVEEALTAAQHVDYLLLDSGNPRLAVKELGGTGRVHDWSLSRRIRESISIPVFLAGGLHSGNVAAAIEAVQPYGVDLCSGIRTDGKLDAQKLDTFIKSVKTAV